MINDKESFLQEFNQFIDANYKPGGIYAAALGNLWKAVHPTTNWEQFGFTRMSDALFEIADAEHSGWQVLNRGTPHLMLRRVGDVDQPESHGATEGAVPGRWIPRLAQDVWRAFVNEGRGAKRFIHRTRHEVVYDVEVPPVPESEWIEIEPIPQADQQQWAREFLAECGVQGREDLSDTLEKPQWYTHFAHALRAYPTLAHGWNRFRTRRAVDFVHAWCARNDVSMSALTAPNGYSGAALGNERARGQVDGSQTPTPSGELRSILIAAFSRLPTHQMLDIKLPLHVVIAQTRPDLLD